MSAALPDTRRGDWLQSWTGRQVWPLDPRSFEISILDIAHSLSMQCRYGGHVDRFYSVAEHCCLLHDHFAAQGVAPWLLRRALLHDASEAYCVDVPRPLKRDLAGYAAIEARIAREISARFGWPVTADAQIEAADRAICLDERAQAMAGPPAGDWGIPAPLGVRLKFWTPRRARAEFLARFVVLFPQDREIAAARALARAARRPWPWARATWRP